jgi:hypothetical protein
MSKAENPSIGAYRGASRAEYPHLHRRNIGDFELIMESTNSRIPPFDTILQTHLEQALAQGRNTVTVVDLGAGDAHVTRHFLSNPHIGKRSREALAQNPQMKLNFVSITDAQSEEEFMQPQKLAPLEEPSADNKQITAINIPYTVTSSQPISKLLLEQEIGKIDVGLAMGFFSHLRPVVFDQAMRDTIDALQPGGELLVLEYASVAGSRLSKDDNHTDEDEPVSLPIRSEGEITWVDTNKIRSNAEKLLEENPDDDTLFQEAKKINWGTIEAEARYGDSLNPHNYPHNPTVKEHFLWTINVALTDAEEILRVNKVREEKIAILDSMAQDYDGEVIIRSTKNALHVKKLSQ